MDFMNLNQSAHGDREHGYIGARLRIPRKIIIGYWQVNTWPVGQLADEIAAVTEKEIDALMDEYKALYNFKTDDMDAVRYQAREEIAIGRILEENGAGAFTNTFEDLYGMRQLPGLATQRLMGKGCGYGGEGDWKTAALTRVVKAMTEGLDGGTSFMEDYTYDLEPGNELVLGAHMLEVCPSIAAGKPSVEVHPLGIGGKEPPARLVFEGRKGAAAVITLVDMGSRFRLILQDIEAVKPICPMPNLPVARVMWRPLPDFYTAAHAWILAGGAHHTVLTYAATPEMLEDWAEIMGLEVVRISAGTDIATLKKELFLSDIMFRL